MVNFDEYTAQEYPEMHTLREWRKMREISCARMAKECGIHENTYRNYEKKPEKISIELAFKIAKVLDVSVDNIIFRANTTKRS